MKIRILLRELTLITAQIHDSLKRLSDGFGLALDDKQLHFFVMLALGMALFLVVNFLFKGLSRVSVTAISFIYVFTVMTFIGFGIEIGQGLSGTGNMEFDDIVAGLLGVLAFFAAYTVYRLLAMLVRWLWRRHRERKERG